MVASITYILGALHPMRVELGPGEFELVGGNTGDEGFDIFLNRLGQHAVVGVTFQDRRERPMKPRLLAKPTDLLFGVAARRDLHIIERLIERDRKSVV